MYQMNNKEDVEKSKVFPFEGQTVQIASHFLLPILI